MSQRNAEAVTLYTSTPLKLTGELNNILNNEYLVKKATIQRLSTECDVLEEGKIGKC